eukprot:scaffold24860_cov122-Cylindrotheca_fusiformis.AAC.2
MVPQVKSFPMSVGTGHAAFSILLMCCFICLPGLGMALTSQTSSSSLSSTTQQLVTNWFSIAAHLQDPTLYSAEWANACEYPDQTLVTSRNVGKYEIVSLCAVHAVGLEGTSKKNNDWMVFDAPKDGDYFFPSKGTREDSRGFRRQQEPLMAQKSPFRYYMKLHESNEEQLVFCDLNPTRAVQPGWMGHLARKAPNPSSNENGNENGVANCFVLPIAPPLCALVSNQEIPKGACLLESTSNKWKEDPDVAKTLMHSYRPEIAELQGYMKMAHPKEEEDPRIARIESDNNNSHKASDRGQDPSFYSFPTREIPDLQVLHENPDIFAVPDFLTESECDRLVAKAKPHLIPCVTKNPNTGAVEQDPSRTSRNTNVPQVEVPTIVTKLSKLTHCEPDQLEVLQVLHYAPGQYFEPHTDGFTGLISACGFENSARLVTVFVYLNDVQKGGATRFHQLGLDVKPQKGMAVVHFPTSLEFLEDARTEHQGMPAIDEKWLLVTWVWMHKRDPNSVYAEEYLDPLDAEII